MKLRSSTQVQGLEPRHLLAFSSYATLIGQDQAITDFSSFNGQGQTVAVIDTGIDYTHPSLGSGFGSGKKVVAGYDFVDNDPDPIDTDGHGTSVAGLIAANAYTYQGVQYQGIAPAANLVALRVGAGTEGIADSTIEQALQWVISNYATYDISVINLSIGAGNYTTDRTNATLSDEFQTLADLDIVVIAASGNSGVSRISGRGVAYPAADPNVIAVGAVNAEDNITNYTQRGATLDLLAPGSGVISTTLAATYESVAGTSFASPITAGVAALIKQVANYLTEDDVASILRQSGSTNYDGDVETGNVTATEYSRINVDAAITYARALTTGTLDSLPGSRSLVLDSAYDRDNVLQIAYIDSATGAVKVSTQLGNGRWSSGFVVSPAGVTASLSVSIAMDDSGKIAVAYYNDSSDDLVLATLENGVFSNTTIDAGGNVGQYASLLIADDGKTVISYYDQTNADLKIAVGSRRQAYTIRTVDLAGNVGAWSSLASVTSSGTVIVAIAYADDTNGNLKYSRAFGTAGAFETFVVDDQSGVANIDLSLEGGRAAIAFRDVNKGDVKYAYRDTTWFTETVAAAGALGQSIDLYYNTAGQLNVAYYNRTKRATYVASRSTSGVWSNSRIGTGGQTISVATSSDSVISRLILDRPGRKFRELDVIS